MSLTPVDILPFVTPVTDPTISEMDFSVAVDDWNESLSRILKHNTKAFWTELLQNQSLSRFLNSFLGEYASFRGNKGDIWIMELEEVVRRVFMIYHRIAESMTDNQVTTLINETQPIASLGFDDAGSALLDTGLVSTSVLMDLAGIYGSSDPEGVSKMVSTFLQNTPSLIGDFRTSTGTVVQIIRRVQKKFEKGITGGSGGSGAGKGKGKGKSVSPAVPASPEPSTPEQDEEKRTEAFQYASALANVAYAIDSISAVSPTLATELHQHAAFMQCLFGCYNYTLPILTKVLIESTTGGEFRSQAVLNFLRLKMLSIVRNILESIVKDHQQTVGDDEDDEDSMAALTDTICRLVADLDEQSPLQEDMVPMFDAPIILDLEIQFSLSEMLSMWITDVFHGENDRIAFWVEKLRNLLSFNPATITFLDEHNMRKSEKMARAMSHLYINEEKSRSGSTIHTGSYMGTPPPLPARNAAQEEDYVKRTLLISQLQDLFPDLGDGFLEACLISFKDDPESVTMHLLEEDLPSDLATMDRSTVRAPQQTALDSMALVQVPAHDDVEEQDVLSTRRNIFDGDEFDMFSGNQVDKTKMYRGKKGPKDVEVVLDDKEFVTQHKSAIMKAVESMYDDEYDDTYDSMGLTNNTQTSFKLVDAVNEDESNNTQPQQLATSYGPFNCA
ncbi:Activating signal cointegrator 1 complex subunit 2 [Mortierella hygrophila]|uniref:Activating signal cointegrator 1 complex subunit 2 n=1 Tax=Mortierella hygrophila TaxID=979708 RepID=A0A9P6F9I0_9FUNG|nr:Activating signal cointegrator 1 complex subunit 2 [Mortierella hygrophila]